MSRTSPYPFLKWAGGKARMIPHVLSRLPREIGTYGELMVGAGSVFLELARLGRFRSAVIADSNAELMNTWRAVREDVDGLVLELRRPEYSYDKNSYLAFRALDPAVLSRVEAAARFIYLNRTCFNGLYRVNRDGRFNVPFGRYTDPVICDEPNLRAVSAALERVELITCDVSQALSGFAARAADGGPVSAVYIDPPYIPVSKTSKFVSYTSGGFSLEDQARLAASMADLARSGVRVVTSNSGSPKAVEILSPTFDIDFVRGTRSVAGGAGDRKTVQEIIAFTGPRS